MSQQAQIPSARNRAEVDQPKPFARWVRGKQLSGTNTPGSVAARRADSAEIADDRLVVAVVFPLHLQPLGALERAVVTNRGGRSAASLFP